MQPVIKTSVLGTCFVRTDQLDGETDWKLKVAIHGTQALERNSELFRCEARISAEKPHNDIHSFIGSFSMVKKQLLIRNAHSCGFLRSAFLAANKNQTFIILAILCRSV